MASRLTAPPLVGGSFIMWFRCRCITSYCVALSQSVPGHLQSLLLVTTCHHPCFIYHNSIGGPIMYLWYSAKQAARRLSPIKNKTQLVFIFLLMCKCATARVEKSAFLLFLWLYCVLISCSYDACYFLNKFPLPSPPFFFLHFPAHPKPSPLIFLSLATPPAVWTLRQTATEDHYIRLLPSRAGHDALHGIQVSQPSPHTEFFLLVFLSGWKSPQIYQIKAIVELVYWVF